jgi:hypothetical protein
MAVRFYGDFKNDVGDYFRINIYDNDYSSSATELTVATPGFTLTYEGNNQEQYQPIIPSRCDFTFYNEGGAFDTFLNSVLPAASESRFPVEILTNPGFPGSQTVFWRGLLLTEQTQQMDEPTPSAVNFTASDDLAQLKQHTFDELSDAVGDDVIIKRVHQMLSLTRCKSLYTDAEEYLRYGDDFQPSDYTGDDYIGGAAITDVTIPGTDPVEYANCYDVLRSIAISFNARIFQAHGVWYFWPMNLYQRRSDADSFVDKLHALAGDASTYTWTALSRSTFYSNMLNTNGTVIQKMAGNTIEYSPPVKRVDRQRITQLGEYLFQENTGFITIDGSTNDITFADDDRTYFAGSTHLITLDYNIDIAAVSASPNNLTNYHEVKANLLIKFGDQYWSNQGWTSLAQVRTVSLGNYYKSQGFEDINSVSVQVPSLVDDEVGLDVTLNVIVTDGDGTNITDSIPTHNMLFILRIFAGDSADTVGDEVVFSSETSLDNQVVLTQDSVITGNVLIGYGTGSNAEYYNGSYVSNLDETDWISSQSSAGYSLHRLGVREIMFNVQLPHKIRQGSFYVDSSVNFLWLYDMIVESSEKHVMHEMSYSANDSEYTIERFQLNQDTDNLSFRADQVVTNNPRDRFVPSGSSINNRVVSALDQRFRHSSAQFYEVIVLEHEDGDTYQIDTDDSNGFVYMNKWIDAGTGTSTVYLPKVAENEGRLLRFKSDSSIAANQTYQVYPYSTDSTAGVRIDGATHYRAGRPYDGITMLCHDGQWYIIQQKEK